MGSACFSNRFFEPEDSTPERHQLGKASQRLHPPESSAVLRIDLPGSTFKEKPRRRGLPTYDPTLVEKDGARRVNGFDEERAALARKGQDLEYVQQRDVLELATDDHG